MERISALDENAKRCAGGSYMLDLRRSAVIFPRDGKTM
jgi:hypothetical protein